MTMSIRHLSIEGAFVITKNSFWDPRGCFTELYKRSDFLNANVIFDLRSVVQTNVSVSRKNVFRGLHFQKNPHAQGKLVTCLSGWISDYIVDLRKDSPTFKCWIRENIGPSIDPGMCSSVYLPSGCAHGFLAHCDDTVVMYQCNGGEYNKEHEGGVRYDDPELQLMLMELSATSLIVSDKDKELPFLKDVIACGGL